MADTSLEVKTTYSFMCFVPIGSFCCIITVHTKKGQFLLLNEHFGEERFADQNVWSDDQIWGGGGGLVANWCLNRKVNFGPWHLTTTTKNCGVHVPLAQWSTINSLTWSVLNVVAVSTISSVSVQTVCKLHLKFGTYSNTLHICLLPSHPSFKEFCQSTKICN